MSDHADARLRPLLRARDKRIAELEAELAALKDKAYRSKNAAENNAAAYFGLEAETAALKATVIALRGELDLTQKHAIKVWDEQATELAELKARRCDECSCREGQTHYCLLHTIDTADTHYCADWEALP